MRAAIYGAGSLGTILGAYITKNGGSIELINRNKAHIEALQKNGARVTGTVNFTQQVTAYTPQEMSGKYDIIFLDPPYKSELLPAALKAIADGNICAVGAYIVCETENDIPVKAKKLRKDEEFSNECVLNDVFGGNEELFARFTVLKSNLYSHTRITMLTPKVADAE